MSLDAYAYNKSTDVILDSHNRFDVLILCDKWCF